MKSLLGIAAFLSALLLSVQADESPAVPRITPLEKTPTICKWSYEQRTNLETVAVMRMEHLIMGTIVESRDDIIYSPNEPKLNDVLLHYAPDTPKRPRVTYASGNSVYFDVDSTWQKVEENKGEVKCLDGKKRPAWIVQIFAEQETFRLSFYAAPREIFVKKVPQLAESKLENVVYFFHHHTLVERRAFTLSWKEQGEKRTNVRVSPNGKP